VFAWRWSIGRFRQTSGASGRRGDTAHVFDDFAPKLTPSFHVYGITRRGFGESGFSSEGYGADRLGDDVLPVLDALKLEKPILVGHSLGGEELSSVATRYPNRVSALVYLEAGYLGFTYPEGEFRQQFTTTPDGRVGKERDFPGGAVLFQGMKKYANIPVPALAIFAIPHAQPKWMADSADPKVREAAKTSSAAIDALAASQAKAFEDGVPTAHVVRLRNADHYVYLSNEADVLREMKSFLTTLR
jgi:non-heme chloroperoxidase